MAKLPDPKISDDEVTWTDVRVIAETVVRVLILGNGGGVTLCASITIALISAQAGQQIPPLLILGISVFGLGLLAGFFTVTTDLVFKTLRAAGKSIPRSALGKMIGSLLVFSSICLLAGSIIAQRFLYSIGGGP